MRYSQVSNSKRDWFNIIIFMLHLASGILVPVSSDVLNVYAVVIKTK